MEVLLLKAQAAEQLRTWWISVGLRREEIEAQAAKGTNTMGISRPDFLNDRFVVPCV